MPRHKKTDSKAYIIIPFDLEKQPYIALALLREQVGKELQRI
jgi:hypothetical protein